MKRGCACFDTPSLMPFQSYSQSGLPLQAFHFSISWIWTYGLGLSFIFSTWLFNSSGSVPVPRWICRFQFAAMATGHSYLDNSFRQLEAPPWQCPNARGRRSDRVPDQVLHGVRGGWHPAVRFGWWWLLWAEHLSRYNGRVHVLVTDSRGLRWVGLFHWLLQHPSAIHPDNG